MGQNDILSTIKSVVFMTNTFATQDENFCVKRFLKSVGMPAFKTCRKATRHEHRLYRVVQKDERCILYSRESFAIFFHRPVLHTCLSFKFSHVSFCVV